MGRGARCRQPAIRRKTHLIAEAHPHTGILRQKGPDFHLVPILDGHQIFAADVHHRDEDAACLHALITDADLIHEVAPGLFKPADVIGMMDNGHLIRLIIMNLVQIGFPFHFS